jgi:acetylornithine deacetylase/succinyl-diaminopimelate desuccinylase-like protein
VTDDKGPILAAAFAAADLLARRALDLELIFLVEGEEECGSFGFNDAIERHKVGVPFMMLIGIKMQLMAFVCRTLLDTLMLFWLGELLRHSFVGWSLQDLLSLAIRRG